MRQLNNPKSLSSSSRHAFWPGSRIKTFRDDAIIVRFLSIFLFLGLFSNFSNPASSFAFQSTQVESIAAGVFIQGFAPSGMLIQHTPLVEASDITREMIILGEIGDAIPPGTPPYESRLTPFSNFGPFESRIIRVKVQYRFVDPQTPGDPPPFTETPVVEGPDPLAFAFQIPEGDVTGPVLHYRIVGQRIHYEGNQATVLSQAILPPQTPQEPDPFLSVGVQANAAQVLNTDGGRFSVDDGNPADGQTSVDIPSGLLTQPTVITIDQVANGNDLIPPGLVNPVAVYRFTADPPVRGLMQVSLLYPDFEFPQGQDGIVDGTTIPEQNTSIAWWDGFQWRILGAFGNYNANTLSVKVGFLNFLAVVSAAPLSPEDRRPLEKIITPNDDGRNDTITFALGDLSDNIKVEIFSVTGRKIRTLMSSTSLQWDGRDESGGVVESGVYIYQYNVGGKLISGVVAVAK